MFVALQLWDVTDPDSEPEMDPELPDWIAKAMGVLALLVLLSAVIAAASVLLPRLLGL